MNSMNHMKTAENLVRLLEGQFKILGFRFGLDPLLGLVPGAGDLLSFVLGLYLIWIGWQMNLSRLHLTRMGLNLLLDLVLGAIPFFGDIFDFFHKANLKNLEILKKHHATIPQTNM